MAVIEQVIYEVSGAFGANDSGDRRVAFLMAHDDGNDTVMLFHPKDKGGTGCLEFAQPTAKTQNLRRAQQVFITHKRCQETRAKTSVYINLSAAQEKFYRQMVVDAGYKIPRNLTLAYNG